MDYMLLMQVIYCIEGLSDYISDYFFVKLCVQLSIEELREATIVQILEEYPKPLLKEVPFIVPQYIRMIAYCHESYLIPHGLLLLRGFHGLVHVFKGIFNFRALILLRNQVYLSIAPLADELFYAIV